jgi:hypothetical protein
MYYTFCYDPFVEFPITRQGLLESFHFSTPLYSPKAGEGERVSFPFPSFGLGRSEGQTLRGNLFLKNHRAQRLLSALDLHRGDPHDEIELAGYPWAETVSTLGLTTGRAAGWQVSTLPVMAILDKVCLPHLVDRNRRPTVGTGAQECPGPAVAQVFFQRAEFVAKSRPRPTLPVICPTGMVCKPRYLRPSCKRTA